MFALSIEAVNSTVKCAVDTILSINTIRLYHSDSNKWNVIAIGY